MKIVKWPFFVFLFLFFAIFSNFANDLERNLLDKGKTYYSSGKYLEALYFFNEVIENVSSEYSGDAWFWAAKSYLASGDMINAEKTLEYFLLNYPRNNNFSEGHYYKGRVLYMQKEYDKAIELFNIFIRSSPFSPFVSNAYYWIGESLYSTGNFDEALEIFKKVVADYPASYKFEAAQYKISLIDFRYREEELLRLIRWSHEESIKTIEEYRSREENYLQTIKAYQQRIIEMESGVSDIDSEALKRLTEAAQKLEDYLSDLKDSEIEETEASAGEE